MVAQIRHKSYRYKARTSWTGERRGAMSAAGRPDIPVGSPPEFRGDGKSWAPEELLLGSVNANFRHFELGIADLAQGEIVYPGVIRKILTHPVNGLDSYQEVIRLLTEAKTAGFDYSSGFSPVGCRPK